MTSKFRNKAEQEAYHDQYFKARKEGRVPLQVFCSEQRIKNPVMLAVMFQRAREELKFYLTRENWKVFQENINNS